MKADQLIKMAINIVGFPFSITNALLQKKRYVEEIGHKVKVNDRVIHTIVSGDEDANVTVIFDAGMSCCSLDWHYIQPKVSEYARTVSFDRAGYGWSSASQGAYTSEDVVNDLKQILEELKIKPPYVLVGHSFGGLTMRLFASKFPNEVASVLLIDPVHENRYVSSEWDHNRRRAHRKNLNMFRFGYLTSGIGLPKLLKHSVGRRNLPEPYGEHATYIGYHPKSYEAVYKELLYSEKSARQVKDAAPLPEELPVTIISSNNTDPTWVEQQKLLLHVTKNTKQIKTTNNHSIHLENPDIIIGNLKEMIDNDRKIIVSEG